MYLVEFALERGLLLHQLSNNPGNGDRGCENAEWHEGQNCRKHLIIRHKPKVLNSWMLEGKGSVRI